MNVTGKFLSSSAGSLRHRSASHGDHEEQTRLAFKRGEEISPLLQACKHPILCPTESGPHLSLFNGPGNRPAFSRIPSVFGASTVSRDFLGAFSQPLLVPSRSNMMKVFLLASLVLVSVSCLGAKENAPKTYKRLIPADVLRGTSSLLS